MSRPTPLPGEISDADYALCRSAAAAIHKAHPFVRGKAPADMTAEHAALRRDYLSLALVAVGDRFGDRADYDQRLALAQTWIARSDEWRTYREQLVAEARRTTTAAPDAYNKGDRPLDDGVALVIEIEGRSPPPPAGMSNRDRSMLIFETVQATMQAYGGELVEEAKLMTRLHDLAGAHGCPPGVPMLPWLEQQGLVWFDASGELHHKALPPIDLAQRRKPRPGHAPG